MRLFSRSQRIVLQVALSIIFISSPLMLYWLIHGSYERYMWIISGPFPFSHLGSAPAQLLLDIFFVSIGIILIIFACRQSKK